VDPVKLVASLIVHDELDRYLPLCVESLLEFCDEIRVIDDRSSDGTAEFLASCGDRVRVRELEGPGMFEHEGRARNQLLTWTMQARPTHILAIDADEFVADGQAVRDEIRNTREPVFTLCMEEVWQAQPGCYLVRCDGGWCPHPVPVIYRPQRESGFRIADKALACGREPLSVRRRARRALHIDVALLHFGWANERERVARHQRYAVADGGRFHASRHLDSILWPADKVRLEERDLPVGLSVYADAAARARA
jgi:glycosyltransferase involved in cell wall biosynthesis